MDDDRGRHSWQGLRAGRGDRRGGRVGGDHAGQRHGGPAGGCSDRGGIRAGCYFFATTIKQRFGYDDTLDVFGVHGVGGIVGALLTGVFAAAECGGVGLAEGVTIGGQVWAQAKSILVTAVWSGVVSAIAFAIIDRFVGMRVAVEVERGGLDLAEHHEQAYEIV